MNREQRELISCCVQSEGNVEVFKMMQEELKVPREVLDAETIWDSLDEDNLLHHACRHGWSALVKELVENQKMDVSQKRGPFGPTPLMLAAGNGRVDIATILLDAPNIDMEQRSGLGTALHWAVKSRQSEMIKLLLSRGADCGAVDAWGCSVLEAAAWYIKYSYLHRYSNEAKAMVKFLAKEACLRVTQEVLVWVAEDPDTLEVCQEARRQPRRLEDLATVAAWKTPITIRRRLLPKPVRKFVNFEEN